MSRLAAGAIVALVFFLGIGVGSLATLAMRGHEPRLRPLHERPFFLDERRLARSLDLSQQQLERLSALRHEHEERLRALRPRLRAELEDLQRLHLNAVDEILEPEQRRQLRQLMEERDRRRHKRRDRSPRTTDH